MSQRNSPAHSQMGEATQMADVSHILLEGHEPIVGPEVIDTSTPAKYTSKRKAPKPKELALDKM